MFNRFIAIDVETSNSDRSSICQVGWVLFENGQIVSEFNSLVNPNAHPVGAILLEADRRARLEGITCITTVTPVWDANTVCQSRNITPL